MFDVMRGDSAGHLADDIHRVYSLILHLVQHHLEFLLTVVHHVANPVQLRRDGLLSAAQEVLDGQPARRLLDLQLQEFLIGQLDILALRLMRQLLLHEGLEVLLLRDRLHLPLLDMHPQQQLVNRQLFLVGNGVILAQRLEDESYLGLHRYELINKKQKERPVSGQA